MTPSNQHSAEAPKPRTKYREPWYFSNDNGDETWYITDGVETFPIHLASPAEFGLALQGTIERSRESTQQRLIEQVEYSIRLQRKLESLGYEAFGDFNLTSGRESKQHTDRETLARVLHQQFEAARGRGGVDPRALADAILAAPSLSLVAARRDFAEKASAHMRANGHGFTRRIDMELLYDALFASGILKPSSGHPVWVAEDGSRHDHPVAGSGHWVHESRSEVEAAALEAAARDYKADHEWLTADEWLVERAARVRSGKDEA